MFTAGDCLFPPPPSVQFGRRAQQAVDIHCRGDGSEYADERIMRSEELANVGRLQEAHELACTGSKGFPLRTDRRRHRRRIRTQRRLDGHPTLGRNELLGRLRQQSSKRRQQPLQEHVSE